MALEDVGPAGADKGKGGKYLITPPDYKDKVPDGYIHLPSGTYQGYALLRSILKSHDDTDIAKAVEYGKRIKLYPLSAETRNNLYRRDRHGCSTGPFPTTSAFSNRSIGWCRPSRGWSATA